MRHDSVVIKPRRYVNVPVQFSPKDSGHFYGEIVMRVEPGAMQLKAHVFGEGTPRVVVL